MKEKEENVDSNELILNISKIHTTPMGMDRIRKNLKLDININPVKYVIKVVRDNRAVITMCGKNWYVKLDGEVITINKYSYTIITAHKEKIVKK